MAVLMSPKKNVGILAMEIYFPPTCIQQEVIESHDGASKGNYTIGLGQECVGFCTELEDVISMSLAAVTSLLDKYGIDRKQIGRLEVGSETVIDKSKSIKTFLMQILEELIKQMRAMGELHLYSIVLIGWKAVHGMDVTDRLYVQIVRYYLLAFVNMCGFPFLVVDGNLSQTCYLMALDSCYKRFCAKFGKWEGKPFSISQADYFVFHSPYNKLVQKSFARLCYDDFLRNPSFVDQAAREKLAPFSALSGDESHQSRDLEKAGKWVIMFSHGSGLTATMLSFQLHECEYPFSLSNIAAVMKV